MEISGTTGGERPSGTPVQGQVMGMADLLETPPLRLRGALVCALIGNMTPVSSMQEGCREWEEKIAEGTA